MKEEKTSEIKDLESRLDRIVEWVKVCDTKTSFLLALVGVMLPLVLQSELLQKDMMTAFRQISNSSGNCFVFFLSFLYVVVVMLFGFLLLASCWKFLNVLFAKHTETLSERIIGSPVDTIGSGVYRDSLLHFHHISSLSFEQFKAGIDAETTASFREDILSQIYINARRCNEKYSYYNDGVRFLYYCGISLLAVYLLHMILFGA